MTDRKWIFPLLYIANATRPDIGCVAGILSRYMEKPSNSHCGVGPHVLRYLEGPLSAKIWICNIAPEDDDIVRYTDPEFSGDHGDKKSTSGYVFTYAGGTIC